MRPAAPKAADTSVVVAAFASWHDKHDEARRALDGGLSLIGHCALEAYSVLTRLPAPHRAPGTVVRDFLRSRFATPYLQLTVARYRAFVEDLPDRGILGGAAYDALVAATAAASGAELVTCDRRALPVYERYGVRTLVVT
ncbi:MAG TPA: PIN domain-containing protein [Casimicrobiaceae bacterium]